MGTMVKEFLLLSLVLGVVVIKGRFRLYSKIRTKLRRHVSGCFYLYLFSRHISYHEFP